MDFLFWRANRRAEELRQQQLKEMRSGLEQQDMHTLVEQVGTVQERMNKLARLHYRNSQELTDQLTAVDKRLETRLAQTSTDMLSVQQLVPLIDELDLARQNLSNGGGSWGELLGHWTKQLLDQLQALGIREIPVEAKPLDPRIAEAVAAEEAPATAEELPPYTVIRVLRRGFAAEDGQVIRKARVVTVKERSYDEKIQQQFSTDRGD